MQVNVRAAGVRILRHTLMAHQQYILQQKLAWGCHCGMESASAAVPLLRAKLLCHKTIGRTGVTYQNRCEGGCTRLSRITSNSGSFICLPSSRC